MRTPGGPKFFLPGVVRHSFSLIKKLLLEREKKCSFKLKTFSLFEEFILAWLLLKPKWLPVCGRPKDLDENVTRVQKRGRVFFS